MSRRSDHNRSSAPADPVALFAGCGLALIVARYVLPAESAHLGETLWIVPLWLILAFLWILAQQRFELPRMCLDRGDWAVLLLAGGQVLAGLASHGNLRAALNGLTEWIGVAATVILLRRWLADEQRWQQFLAVLATAGIVLSGLGVWQYAVEYPALRRDVEELTRLETEQETRTLTERDASGLRQLKLELGQLANENDPNVRFALRQRLMRSTEPLACFALTNTLGGVLAISLLLLIGGWTGALAGQPSWQQMARIFAPVLLVGFCLLLTKSRTAWIGLIFAATAWSLVALRGSLLSQRTFRFAALGGIVVAVLVAGAWFVGALDRLVVLESSKSLKYRIEYWTGAWGVIRNHILLGVGPGNFRQNYLRHKVVGSSEEILDPHNLFLDVWASGGILALLGLVAVVGLTMTRWRRIAAAAPSAVAPKGISARPDRTVLLSGAAGITLVWLKLGLIDLHWDQRLLALLAGWIVTALILPPLRFSAASQMAATLALGVHLLGAGGVGMPLVGTLLLLLGLGPSPAVPSIVTPESPRREQRLAIATGIALAGLIVCTLKWAVIPATLANLNTDAAMSVMQERGDAATARRLLHQAIEADPLDPQPHVYLAQLDYDASRARDNHSLEHATTSLNELNEALRLDPENPKTYWLMAQWKLELRSRFDDIPLTADAVQTAEAAATRDPQNAEVLATLAIAYSKFSHADEARSTASRALELDALNATLGHYDRLLDDAEREQLKEIAPQR
jgi:tetratricopeptide (TPR) repeat protein